MSEEVKTENRMSRRRALMLLGLAAGVGYAAPTVLTVSDAEAGGYHHTRRRHYTHRHHHTYRRHHTHRRHRTHRY